MKRAILSCLIVCAATVAGLAKPKPKPPCKVYVVVEEQDMLTDALPMDGLNKPQHDWYKKHGEQGEYAGVCVVGWEYQETRENFFKHNSLPTPGSAPVYAVLWSAKLVNSLYEGTTRQNYVASGRLEVFDPTANQGKGDFVPIGPLHNTNRWRFTSSSVSLLKAGLEWIAGREGLRR
jgi:hypothetical protein